MEKKELFGQIERQISRCKECRLWRGRKNTVPGEGSLSPKIAFVGEAPGLNEDEQGRPFCGRAGELLDELLGSIGLKRSEAWVGNVLKCRPPENRSPMVDELRNCKPYLDEQLRVLNPKLIVTLGRFGMEHFEKGAQISKDHGVPRRVGNWVIYPLFHPAAALRSVQVLNILRKDFLQIPKVLSGEIEVKKEKGKSDNENQMSLL